MRAFARSLAKLRARYAALSAERRSATLAGAAAATFLLLYLAAALPLRNELPRLHASLADGRAKLAGMHAQAVQADALRARPPEAASSADAQKAVEQAIDAHGLRATMKRIAPEAGNAVQMTLEGAPFEVLLAALAELDGQRVRAENVALEARSAGTVDARLLLRGPRP